MEVLHAKNSEAAIHGRISGRGGEVSAGSEGGLGGGGARLDLPAKSLANWVRAARAGKPVKVQEAVHQVSDLEAEVSRLRAENARLKMEREILRKAAAYFAKDAL